MLHDYVSCNFLTNVGDAERLISPQGLGTLIGEVSHARRERLKNHSGVT